MLHENRINYHIDKYNRGKDSPNNSQDKGFGANENDSQNNDSTGIDLSVAATLTPENQRAWAAKRRAQKKAQRERARTLPPKPKPFYSLLDSLMDKGALQVFEGEGYSIDLTKLPAHEREQVADVLAVEIAKQGGLI